jgi:hypothetical protein
VDAATAFLSTASSCLLDCRITHITEVMGMGPANSREANDFFEVSERPLKVDVQPKSFATRCKFIPLMKRPLDYLLHLSMGSTK